MKRFKYTLLFIMLGLSLANPAHAQELSLELWPPLLEVMIQPGKSITQVFELTNTGTSDLVLTSRLVPFEPLGSNGQIKLLENPPNNQHLTVNNVRFFSFQNADLALGNPFTLKAGQHRQIVLKISISAEETEKDHYFTLLFESLSSLPAAGFTGESAVGSRIRVGTNLLLTISRTGQPTLSAVLSAFHLKGALFCVHGWCVLDSFSPPEFEIKLANSGRTLFKTDGSLTASGWFYPKTSLNLLPENILAASSRRLRCGANNEISTEGSDQPSLSPALCRLPGGFFIGPGEAGLTIQPNDTALVSGSVTWFSLPLKLLITLGVTGIFLRIIYHHSLQKT